MSLVQQLVCTPNGNHQDTVRAVAFASLACHIVDPDHPNWEQWLSGRFTKTVRRVKITAKLNEITNQCASEGGLVCHMDGITVAAFIPDHPEKMSAELRACQVSEFNRPRDPSNILTNQYGTVDGYPRAGDDFSKCTFVCLNPRVEMSTGKTAAQVAHGFWSAYLNFGAEASQIVIRANSLFHSVEINDADLWEPYIYLRDAGLTEIDPDTETIRITKYKARN